jgi:hypothetical protein
VKRSKGGDLLGLQQFAECLSVGGVHRWGVWIVGGQFTFDKRGAPPLTVAPD